MSVIKFKNNGIWEEVVCSSPIELDGTLSTSGIPADAKAVGDAISILNNRIGDKPIHEQIAEAIVEVYVQGDEPTSAPEGSIWIDESESGLPNIQNPTAKVYVVDAATTDITTVDFSKYAIGDVILVTSS